MAAESRLDPAVPVLRVHDGAVALEFYRDYLGFEVEWEHRFAPELPLYVRVRRDATTLDLTEHHGDGTPGSVAWVPVSGLVSLHAELEARGHAHSRPGIDPDAPGGPTMAILDPSGNELRFCEPREER